MAHKHSAGQAAQEKILEGVRLQKEFVCSTMGPDGNVVLIDKGPNNTPIASKDGVTVSKHIKPEDPEVRLGSDIVYQAARDTNDIAGDATTCATLLTAEIIERGFKYRAGGWNVNHIANGIQKASRVIARQLEEIKKDISTDEDIANIATISSQDPEIGKIISEVMQEIGPESTITVDVHQGIPGMEKDIAKGMQVGNGWATPLFRTDPHIEQYKQDDVAVLVTADPIQRQEQIIPMVDLAVRGGMKNILIVAPHMDATGPGSPMAMLIRSKINEKVGLVPLFVKIPEYGERQTALLRDIATYTGAKFFSSTLGEPLPEGMSSITRDENGKEKQRDDVSFDYFGTAHRVVSNKAETAIVGGGGDKQKIEAHLNDIRASVKGTRNKFEQEFHRERIGSFTKGVGIIRVAAASEIEAEELRLRVDDALASVRSAVHGGVIPGGGVALLRCLPALDKERGWINEGEEQGYKIVREAIQMPAWQIATVSGEKGDAIVAKILESKETNFGFDSAQKRWGDMMKFGIIDPTLAIKTALENAASVAATFLKMYGTITTIPASADN